MIQTRSYVWMMHVFLTPPKTVKKTILTTKMLHNHVSNTKMSPANNFTCTSFLAGSVVLRLFVKRCRPFCRRKNNNSFLVEKKCFWWDRAEQVISNNADDMQSEEAIRPGEKAARSNVHCYKWIIYKCAVHADISRDDKVHTSADCRRWEFNILKTSVLALLKHRRKHLAWHTTLFFLFLVSSLCHITSCNAGLLSL